MRSFKVLVVLMQTWLVLAPSLLREQPSKLICHEGERIYKPPIGTEICDYCPEGTFMPDKDHSWTHCFNCTTCPGFHIGTKCDHTSDTVCCLLKNMTAKDGPGCVLPALQYESKVCENGHFYVSLLDGKVTCKPGTDQKLTGPGEYHVTCTNTQAISECYLNNQLSNNSDQSMTGTRHHLLLAIHILNLVLIIYFIFARRKVRELVECSSWSRGCIFKKCKHLLDSVCLPTEGICMLFMLVPYFIDYFSVHNIIGLISVCFAIVYIAINDVFNANSYGFIAQRLTKKSNSEYTIKTSALSPTTSRQPILNGAGEESDAALEPLATRREIFACPEQGKFSASDVDTGGPPY